MTENVNQEKMQKASTTLATMLDYLGLDATVKAEDRNGRIALIAVSEDAGRIIGRRGQTLDQLQMLLNRMILKNDLDSPRITIDVDGYSKKPGMRRDDRENRRPHREYNRYHDGNDSEHEERIRRQALDAAKEVKRWGEQVKLPPMNAHDRRIVHMTLKEDSEIKTESEEKDGDGKLKSVIISLNKSN